MDKGLTLKLAAASFNVSEKTAAKWVRRPTTAELEARVEVLRRQRWTGARIAAQTALSRATVSRVLRRLKLNRMRDLEPRPVYPRYEHASPGDLLHLDMKKLVRIAQPSHRVTGNRRDTVRGIGSEALHVAIDDHSRIAFSAIYPDETAASALLFLHAAVAYYERLGIRFKAVLTDNGAAYRSHRFAQACRALGLKHRRTRPYTPRTNGKAERFIQTALREWAYARTYQNSNERSQELRPWLHQYNWHRPHSSLGLSPPISRARLEQNNLLSLHN